MKRLALKLAASSLALGFATFGWQSDGFVLASAVANEARADQQATTAQQAARAALARGDMPNAVAQAEQAVALAPSDVGYRMLLGDIYMRSGRFQSAADAYRDVLEIDPGQTRVALSLALMEVASGRSQDAMARLEGLEGRAPAADLGLAFALAGSPQRGVAVLEPAARGMGATARIRQNLALAYAIGGDWARARTIAAQDLSPGELGERMTRWAALAPAPADHVASLLGVSPVQDAGQPVRLAVRAPVAAPEAARSASFAQAAPTAPIQLPPPGGDAVPADASVPVPVPVAVAEAVPAAEPNPAYAELEQPDWGLEDNGSVRLPTPASEAQELPVQLQYAAAAEALTRPDPVAASQRPLRNAVRMVDQIASVPQMPGAAPRRSASGRYVVQIGAFSSAANAERAWQSAERRFGLRAEQPVTMTIDMGGRLLHRVAISGFERRGDATGLCASIRSQGGECFVRNSAGDAAIRWAARYVRRA